MPADAIAGSGFSRPFSLKSSLKGIYRLDCHFRGGIDICNGRLELEKILPNTLFVCFGTGFVAHMARIMESALRGIIFGMRSDGCKRPLEDALLATPAAVWTFSCVFQSPEGRTENSPGLQAWEGLRKENRPERAADFRAFILKS